MSEEEVSISIEDFMSLDEAKISEGKFKQFPDEDYLALLTTKKARNAAWIAQELGVTTYTVKRRLAKLADKILVRWNANDPFYVLKPEKKGSKSEGVEL